MSINVLKGEDHFDDAESFIRVLIALHVRKRTGFFSYAGSPFKVELPA